MNYVNSFIDKNQNLFLKKAFIWEKLLEKKGFNKNQNTYIIWYNMRNIANNIDKCIRKEEKNL